MVDESLGDAAEVFEASVDGFGGAVAGVGVVEVGQDVPGSACEGSAMRASSMHVCGKPGRVSVVMEMVGGCFCRAWGHGHGRLLGGPGRSSRWRARRRGRGRRIRHLGAPGMCR